MTIEIILIITSIIQFCLFYLKRKSKQKFPDFYVTVLILLFFYFIYPKILLMEFKDNSANFVANHIITFVLITILVLSIHLIWFLIKRKIE